MTATSTLADLRKAMADRDGFAARGAAMLLRNWQERGGAPPAGETRESLAAIVADTMRRTYSEIP